MLLVEEAGHRAELELLEARTQERLEHAQDDDAQGSRDDRPPPAGRRRTNPPRRLTPQAAPKTTFRIAPIAGSCPKAMELEEAGRDANEDVADVDRRREQEEQTEQRPADRSAPARPRRAVRRPSGARAGRQSR